MYPTDTTNHSLSNFARAERHLGKTYQSSASLRISVCPDLTQDLVSWLEAQHPPRCFDPSSETIEAHHRYAGKVELIANLRAMLNYSEESEGI